MKNTIAKTISRLSNQECHELLQMLELANYSPYVDNITKSDRNWCKDHKTNAKPRIGIIGINIHVRSLNYACPLHAYAMQQYLISKGYEAEIIDYVPKFSVFEESYDYKNPAKYYQDLKTAIEKKSEVDKDNVELKNALSKICTKIDFYNKNSNIQSQRATKFQNFIKENLIITKNHYNEDSLEYSDPGFDIYICATDVIWDKFYSASYEKGFYLYSQCMKNKWKIAYAASKWTKWTDSDFLKTSEMIKAIDFVSVRESFLKEEIQRKIRHDVAWVVDPVLLNNPSFYRKLAIFPKEKMYILLYCVVEQNEMLISQALKCAENFKAKGEDCKIIVMSDNDNRIEITTDCDIEIIHRYEAGINEWLGCIINASIIYTNSFHCVCLSTLFKKNFYACKRSYYDKIGDYLESIGLGKRILNSNHYIPENGNISNWEEVDKVIKERIRQSELFLDNALCISSDTYPEDKS